VPSVELVKYSAACRALAEAVAVDEVKELHDEAAAFQEYAKQAKNRQMEIDAAAIRIRAERRLGELLRETVKATGTRGKGRPNLGGSKMEPPKKTGGTKSEPPVSDTPTLASLGIDKKLSSRSQKLAAMPEKQFEQKLSTWKEKVEQDKGKVNVDILAPAVHVAANSGQNEWYTPPEYIAAARAVMGGIDCDPASTAIANKIVCADTFYTIKDNGLVQPWGKRVWMNPPYAQPMIAEFAEAVASKYESGEVKQACILCNNATETKWFQRMLSLSTCVCFVAGRIKFLDPQGNPGAPLQGQTVLYFGKNRSGFRRGFTKLGELLWKTEE